MRKKILVLFSIGFVILLALILALRFMDVNQRLRDASGLHLSEDNRVFMSKSAGGFHGDGQDYEIYIFDDKEMNDILEKIEDTNKWGKYPLDSVTSTLLEQWNGYSKLDSVLQESLENSNYKEFIPTIDNGYYLLIDRTDYFAEKPILERGTYNFTLLLLDLDNNTIYYMTLDT